MEVGEVVVRAPIFRVDGGLDGRRGTCLGRTCRCGTGRGRTRRSGLRHRWRSRRFSDRWELMGALVGGHTNEGQRDGEDPANTRGVVPVQDNGRTHGGHRFGGSGHTHREATRTAGVLVGSEVELPLRGLELEETATALAVHGSSGGAGDRRRPEVRGCRAREAAVARGGARPARGSDGAMEGRRRRGAAEGGAEERSPAGRPWELGRGMGGGAWGGGGERATGSRRGPGLRSSPARGSSAAGATGDGGAS